MSRQGRSFFVSLLWASDLSTFCCKHDPRRAVHVISPAFRPTLLILELLATYSRNQDIGQTTIWISSPIQNLSLSPPPLHLPAELNSTQTISRLLEFFQSTKKKRSNPLAKRSEATFFTFHLIQIPPPQKIRNPHIHPALSQILLSIHHPPPPRLINVHQPRKGRKKKMK